MTPIVALALGCGTPAPMPADPAPASRTAGALPESDRPVEGASLTRSAAGHTVRARWEPGALGSELVATDAAQGERVLVGAAWNADRPAISADGELVAFVSGKTGLASIWVVPWGGGEPRQVTNVGVVREKGRPGPPEGFVPPPVDASLRFEGRALAWTGPDGEHRAELP